MIPSNSACLVVSAYHDGGQLFRTIKEKWHNRRHPNEASAKDLERSLIRGHEDILTQWNARAAHLGRRYEEGDAIAREQMKDIVITLQSALLTHLRWAEGHEARLDMLKLLAASDRGRARTISVLHDLYQRQAQSAAIPWPIALAAGPAVVDPTSSLGYYMDLIEKLSSSQPADARNWSDGGWATPGGGGLSALITESPPETHGSLRQIGLVSPLSRDRRSSTFGSISSWWKDLQRRRSSADASAVAEVESIPRPAFHYPAFPQSLATSREPETREDEAEAREDRVPKVKKRRRKDEQDEITRELTTNIWNHDTKSETDSETEYESAEEGDILPLHSELQTTREAPTPIAPLPNTTAPSVVSSTRVSTLDRAPVPSIASSETSTSNQSSYITRNTKGISYWPPSKDNHYSGFCKGAWKLNSGMGGLKVHSEPVGYFTLITKLRCYKCFFAMPLAKNCSRNDHRPDTRTYVHGPTGIRYRWSFLAKSHIECKRADVEMPHYVRGSFGCIFCCAQKNEPAPRFDSLDAFMEHLGVNHRCMNAAALLERTRCVVGRVADEDEEFDINIPPAHPAPND